jgi:hypothetical protein
VTMLGLLGLRIFEATSTDIADLSEEHGHRVLRVCGKGTKIVLVPLPPAVGRAIDRAVADRTRRPVLLTAAAPGRAGTRPTAACAGSPQPPASRPPGHTRTCSATHSPPPCSTHASTSGTSRSPPATPTRACAPAYLPHRDDHRLRVGSVTRARLPNRGCGSMLWLWFARPRYGGSCSVDFLSRPRGRAARRGRARGMMGA